MANINISNETVILSKSAEDIESILSGYSDLTNSVLTEVLNRETADNELSLRISNINGVEYIQVDELPSEPLKDHFDAFYIVANGRKEDNNLFTEYYWKEGKWETFGSASLDLSSYVKKSEIDTAPTANSTNPVTSGGVKSALDGKADKQNESGGFKGGYDNRVEKGGAIGYQACTHSGGAVGNGASSGEGGAIGNAAHTYSHGGAIGYNAESYDGGAIGYNAKAGDGFSGGKGATTLSLSGKSYVDAIQLGTGNNYNQFTMNVYDYQLIADDGSRDQTATDGNKYLKDVGKLSNLTTTSKTNIVSAINEVKSNSGTVTESGGFAAGNGAQVSRVNGTGGAIGNSAYSISGGAVGEGAFADGAGGAVGYGTYVGDGFAGGKNAKAASDDGTLDAIQLGTGTNGNEFSMQVYDYQLLANDATTKSATDGSKYLKDVGKLSSLQTNNKNSIIDAINELKTQIDLLSTQVSELKTASSSTK